MKQSTKRRSKVRSKKRSKVRSKRRSKVRRSKVLSKKRSKVRSKRRSKVLSKRRSKVLSKKRSKVRRSKVLLKQCRKEKISITMAEFKRGELKMRNKKQVTNPKQAIAIALSQADRYC